MVAIRWRGEVRFLKTGLKRFLSVVEKTSYAPESSVI